MRERTSALESVCVSLDIRRRVDAYYYKKKRGFLQDLCTTWNAAKNRAERKEEKKERFT